MVVLLLTLVLWIGTIHSVQGELSLNYQKKVVQEQEIDGFFYLNGNFDRTLEQSAVLLIYPGGFIPPGQYTGLAQELVQQSANAGLNLDVVIIDIPWFQIFGPNFPIEERNQISQDLFEQAIFIAQSQGATLLEDSSNPGTFSNVYAAFHSGGTDFALEPFTIPSLAGLISLGSIVNPGPTGSNKLTQLPNSVPFLLVNGDRDGQLEYGTTWMLSLNYLSLVGTLGPFVATRRLALSILPQANHWVYTNDPNGGAFLSDLPPILSANQGHRLAAKPVIDFLLVQEGIDSEAATQKLMQSTVSALRFFTPFARSMGFGFPVEQFNRLAKDAACELDQGVRYASILDGLFEPQQVNKGPFVPYLTSYINFRVTNNPLPYQQYVDYPQVQSLASSYCVAAQKLVLRGIPGGVDGKLSISCVPYTDPDLFAQVSPTVVKIPGGVQVVAAILSRRIPASFDIPNTFQAQISPIYQMQLATCSQVVDSCQPGVGSFGQILNTASMEAAEKLVTAKQLQSFRQEGLQIAFGDDVRILPRELDRWFLIENAFEGFSTVEAGVQYVSQSVFDPEKGVYYVQVLSVASMVEWIQLQSFRPLPGGL